MSNQRQAALDAQQQMLDALAVQTSTAASRLVAAEVDLEALTRNPSAHAHVDAAEVAFYRCMWWIYIYIMSTSYSGRSAGSLTSIIFFAHGHLDCYISSRVREYMYIKAEMLIVILHRCWHLICGYSFAVANAYARAFEGERWTTRS